MHIGLNAHLLSFRPGYRRAGVSQYVEQMLRGLSRDLATHRDTLTVFAGPDPPPASLHAPQVSWQQTRLPTGSAPGRIVWEQCIAPIAVRRAHIDVLFCPVNVVPLATALPSVVTVHDLAFVAHPEAFHASKRRYLNLMTRLSVRRARQVIAVSAHTKADLVRHFGVSPDRITVIPNAADPRFRPADNPDALRAFRAAHHLPERFILFVGTLEPRKNLRRLIEAFIPLAVTDPNLQLVILGASGWLTSDIAPLVAQHAIADRINFPGYVSDDDLPCWYQAATIFCYPSLYEGFGLPVLEAMACGVPVVTANTSSIPEVTGDAAILIEPTDVTALRSALQTLLDDPARRDALRAAGIARATHYSWDSTVHATRAVLAAAMQA